jgi:hypothetical protein
LFFIREEGVMQIQTVVAIVLAPLLVPLYRWLFTLPGRKVHDWLWVHLPEGRLRRILLKKV